MGWCEGRNPVVLGGRFRTEIAFSFDAAKPLAAYRQEPQMSNYEMLGILRRSATPPASGLRTTGAEVFCKGAIEGGNK
jgi:hypothetical protein